MLQPGTKLNHKRYHILEQLGEGGFAITYRAEDRQRPGNPTCVVKEIEPQVTPSYTLQQAKDLFEREAASLEKLGKHDQIPQLLAYFEENQKFYIVQEFIEGEQLAEEIKNKRFSEIEAIELLQEILEVLDVVHQNNIIHRDLKPSNIIRRKDGKIVLIDFGAVKEISTQTGIYQGSTSRTCIGTPGYIPVEQKNGHPEFCSDIYAVGIIAIQALTGIDPQEIYQRSANKSILNQLLYNYSFELSYVLDKMVKNDSTYRYQSVEKVLKDITRLKNLYTHTYNSLIKTINKLSFQLYTVRSSIFLMKRVIRKIVKKNKLIIVLTLLPIISGIMIVKFNNFQTYHNQDNKITIKYPRNWTLDPNPPLGTLVTFVSPLEDNSDQFQENINISVSQDLSTNPITLKKFTDSRLKEISKSRLVTDESMTIANNLLAHKAIYSDRDGEYNLTWMQIWTIKNNKAYIITFEAEADKYPEYLKLVQTAIDSFKIE